MFGACGSRDSVPANVATSVTGRAPYMRMVVKAGDWVQVDGDKGIVEVIKSGD